MKMNVAYNGVGEEEPDTQGDKADQIGEPANGEIETGEAEGKTAESEVEAKRPGSYGMKVDEHGNLPNGRRPNCKGKVRVNEGDAWYVDVH
jgi:hypothetical protein